MDRATRRRIDKIRNTEEVEYLLDKERNSIRRLEQIDRKIAFDIMRSERIGKEKANRLLDKIYKELRE